VVEALLRSEADYTPAIVDTIYFERARESPRVKLLRVTA
jgi:hypothetical protein